MVDGSSGAELPPCFDLHRFNFAEVSATQANFADLASSNLLLEVMFYGASFTSDVERGLIIDCDGDIVVIHFVVPSWSLTWIDNHLDLDQAVILGPDLGAGLGPELPILVKIWVTTAEEASLTQFHICVFVDVFWQLTKDVDVTVTTLNGELLDELVDVAEGDSKQG